ncbi:MAG: SDR family oxidoreductase [Dehalococcoidia bacterium]
MDFTMTDKVAVVTGGSRGIGRAIALRFAESGAKVVIAGRDAETLATTEKELWGVGCEAGTVQVDVGAPGALNRIAASVLDRFGGVDVLVNNAYLSGGGMALLDVTEDLWNRIFRVNVWAPFELARLVYPSMSERGGGSIINIASNEGIKSSGPGLGAYATSKAAMIMLTRVCAIEWAKENIRVNSIAPGLVRTDGAKRLIDHVQKTGQHFARLERFAEPDEIAPLALYLASSAGSFATGACFVIDGGELA